MDMDSFPIGSSVLLKGLVKGAHLNDKKGIVKAPPNAAGRQEVYVFEAQKSMAIRPANLAYEPRELSSLSASELKGVLLRAAHLDAEPAEWAGLAEDELRRRVAAAAETEDPEELAALVAHASAPAAAAGGGSAAAPVQSPDTLRQGAERMSEMSPDDIRQQAATMKAMGPATLRKMNPAMATLTDAQIDMAIAQMEAVASNPDQLKMMANQMKNMTESEIRQAVNQSPLHTPLVPPAAPPSAPDGPLVSQSQFERATQQMSSMSPEQLRQQARTLRAMPRDALRKSNPTMARMSDAQIDASVAQLEQMAENPDLIRMATEQMQNLTPEQYESMQGMFASGASSAAPVAAGAGAAPGAAGVAAGGPPADPSQMLEALLGSPEQLNSMVKIMQQNPAMMKQMLASQLGLGAEEEGADGAGHAAKRAQIAKMERYIDSFAGMDEKSLDRYLKAANVVQKVAKPLWTVFAKAKGLLGVSAKTLAVALNVLALAGGVLLVRWWRARGGDPGGAELLATEHEVVSSGGEGYEQSEF